MCNAPLRLAASVSRARCKRARRRLAAKRLLFLRQSKQSIMRGVLMAVHARFNLAGGSHFLGVRRDRAIDPSLIRVLGLGVDFEHDEQVSLLGGMINLAVFFGKRQEMVCLFQASQFLAQRIFGIENDWRYENFALLLLVGFDFLGHPRLLDNHLANRMLLLFFRSSIDTLVTN